MSAVIYGKHPAFGDFLAHGMRHEVFVVLDRWLESVLPGLRRDLADDWEVAWSNAPVLRFWVGPRVLGEPLMGLFMTSRDRVGRRYPLIFGLTGPVTPPPVHKAHDESPYDHLWAHVAGFQMPEERPQGAETLLRGFTEPQVQGAPWEPGTDTSLWGQRSDDDLGRLFADARAADAQQAQLARSHWWHPGLPNREAGWLGATGLPDAAALNWLLTQRPRQAEAPAEPVKDPRQAPMIDTDAEGEQLDD
jgi:type VI secretion system protein ImpM